MKIGAVFTGGTIGSQMDAKGKISTDDRASFQLIKMYQELPRAREVEFVIQEPYQILSENLQGKHITTLVECVEQMQKTTDIDGILIMHGTDTLQYTAAMLRYVFCHSPIPIVLVSSNYVLSDPRANGLQNFAGALDFIALQPAGGVYVSYANTGEDCVIYNGATLSGPVPYSDVLSGVKQAYWGKFRREDNFLYFEKGLQQEAEPQAFDLQRGVECLSETQGQILWIRPYPGMKYPEISPQIKAVLHESYHSGTIAVGSGMIDFMKEANEKNVPVFLVGLDNRKEEYDTVEVYRQQGMKILPVSAPIAQYCKLWLGISADVDLERFMACSIAGELLES